MRGYNGSGKPHTILSGIHAFCEPEEQIGKTCIAIAKLHFPQSHNGHRILRHDSERYPQEGEEEKRLLLKAEPQSRQAQSCIEQPTEAERVISASLFFDLRNGRSGSLCSNTWKTSMPSWKR